MRRVFAIQRSVIVVALRLVCRIAVWALPEHLDLPVGPVLLRFLVEELPVPADQV
jgi:hypothetical protein